jgi:hypothetical protein
MYSNVTLLTTCFIFQASVVLMLVCYALAMPTSHDLTETLSTTEFPQKAETPNKPAVGQEPSADMFVDRLHLPPSAPAVRSCRSVESIHQDSETPSPNFPTAENSELADDILDGKKAVVMVEFIRSLDNDNDEAAARKQLSAGGITSADKQELATTTAVTEPPSTFPEKTGSSSHNPEEKNVSSGGQREVRSFDSNDHNERDEDNEEDDMSVAETIIFRPLFSYRQDTAARRRYFREVSRNHPGFDYY